MNATQVLAAQHRALQALFEEIEQEVRPPGRAVLVSRIAEELIAHMAAEEAVFYPAVRRLLGGDEHLADESREQHVALRVELRRVLATEAGDPAFADRVRVLRALFERHVHEEETLLFGRVEAALSRPEQAVLGEEILASRPPIWVVTTEGRSRGRADERLRTRVSLPIPPAGE